jgi:hypothetical protein
MWFFYVLSGCAFLVYFNAHPVHLMYTLIGIIICFVIIAINKDNEKNRIKNLKADTSDMIEFARNSKLIDYHQYNMLVKYFSATETNIENVNNFLNSKKGMAFLSSYSKKKDIVDFVSISQLITLSDKNEQLISNAVNIVNEV